MIECSNKLIGKIKKGDLSGKPEIYINSHWNDDELVVLVIGEQKITLNAEEVVAAVQNATNIARF